MHPIVVAKKKMNTVVPFKIGIRYNVKISDYPFILVQQEASD